MKYQEKAQKRKDNFIEIYQKNQEDNNGEYFAGLGDYVTIYSPEYFTKMGFSKEFIDDMTETHYSDNSNPKYTITGNNGKEIKKLNGVMCPTVVSVLCDYFEIDTTKSLPWYGRGKIHQYKLTELFKEVEKIVRENRTKKSVSNSNKSTNLTSEDLGTTNFSY
jgi:hypothetical protein